MNEEEKKAIEDINGLINIFETDNGKDFEATCLVQKEIASNLKILLSLIEKLQKENEKFKKERQIVGMPVRNKRDGRIGIVLHQWESGSVSVLESINPRVINTHDSWNTLEIVTDGVKQDNNDTNVGSI